MPLNLDSFRNIANSTYISLKDIAIQGTGKEATTALGNLIFSAGKKANKAVMDAFKAALENEYGAMGTHAFDTIVGSRSQMKKSLRACDVKAVLSALPKIRENRLVGEINRQLDINPKMMQLSQDEEKRVRQSISDNVKKDLDISSLKTPQDISRAAAKRIEQAIREATKESESNNVGHADLGKGKADKADATAKEPTGLSNLKNIFGKGSTSVEDQVKRGVLGAGMRINRSGTNPTLLDSLKSNGVEPGFIYRNDWSKKDTRGFMADINSQESLAALEALKARNPSLAARCAGKSIQMQIMQAGRLHPAAMAAVSEFVLQQALNALKNPHMLKYHPFCNLAKALSNHFSPQDLQKLTEDVSAPKNAKILNEAKLELFAEIRDAILSVDSKSDFYSLSPVFRHFNERHIQKLDYNESERSKTGATAHEGKFMRPERILATRKPILGQIYRLQTAASADKISAGAVTEALANDLTRIAGIPAQELTISRGQYSDGHPKIMLEAKFAKGYQDMENGYIKDGRIVLPPNARPGTKLESLGKYKAFFLLTADRDGIGKRGQNKGFVNGKFFAIDPGHSLEGNGKYLDIADDFSFKDTYGASSKPRFNNFSVFDDDTRFAKFQGLVELRKTKESGAFDSLFAEYRTAFDPDAQGIDEAERQLRLEIHAEIDKKEAEFKQQLDRLLSIGGMQLELYDDLAADGPEMQEKAINTISHLEMLTSPTTWVSKKGKVALEHLEVKPETRIPWRAFTADGNLVFHTDRNLDGSTLNMLATLTKNAGGTFSHDNFGNIRITVSKANAEKFFATFSEENVQKLTHPAEYDARMTGGDPLKVAKDYKPIEFKHVPGPNPPLKSSQLPEHIEVEVNGKLVNIPKIHYVDMATTGPSATRPRSVDELRASLGDRIRQGLEIIQALRDGKTSRFAPTMGNIVAVTHALHALALQQGQYMYRGAFSVADPDGNIARWLDKAEGLYPRASTHAKPYHSLIVDGHRNEARGLDVPVGMGGLLNGMRTFHYFTIPDTDHIQDAGGSGPRRRLYLKCETYGVFVNKISSENAKASIGKDMKTRGYEFGDVTESILHGLSLFKSYFTPKEAPGIQKENLLDAQKNVIDEAERKLVEAERKLVGSGLTGINERLLAGGVHKGGGIRMLIDNIGDIIDNHMPEDEEARNRVIQVFDELFEELSRIAATLPGDTTQRLGNEIMID